MSHLCPWWIARMFTAAIHFGFHNGLPKYASELWISSALCNAKALRTAVLGQNRRCALLLTRLTQLHLGLTSESVTVRGQKHTHLNSWVGHSSNSPFKGVT